MLASYKVHGETNDLIKWQKDFLMDVVLQSWDRALEKKKNANLFLLKTKMKYEQKQIIRLSPIKPVSVLGQNADLTWMNRYQ